MNSEQPLWVYSYYDDPNEPDDFPCIIIVSHDRWINEHYMYPSEDFNAIADEEFHLGESCEGHYEADFGIDLHDVLLKLSQDSRFKEDKSLSTWSFD